MKHIVYYTEELCRGIVVDADDYDDAIQKVLDAVDNEYADFYSYDMSMGTLETPIAITSIDDLYDYVED